MRRYVALAAWVLASVLVIGASPLLAQAPPAQQGKPKEAPAAAAADPLSGEWDGLVDLENGPMAFSMKLTLDKDKVTGEVGGPQGSTSISEGTWSAADAKLSISFTYVDGAGVVMTGVLKDDTISGSLSYGGGQMIANWAAKKKPAK